MKNFFKNLTNNTPKFALGLVSPLIIVLALTIVFANSFTWLQLLIIIFLTVWFNFEADTMIKETEKLISKISKLFN